MSSSAGLVIERQGIGTGWRLWPELLRKEMTEEWVA